MQPLSGAVGASHARELDSIKANDTYALVPLPAGRQAIGCKRVFKISATQWQHRPVQGEVSAKGYSQLYGIDFTETFAPVRRFSSLRAILAMAAAAAYEIHQMDVKTLSSTATWTKTSTCSSRMAIGLMENRRTMYGR